MLYACYPATPKVMLPASADPEAYRKQISRRVSGRRGPPGGAVGGAPSPPKGSRTIASGSQSRVSAETVRAAVRAHFQAPWHVASVHRGGGRGPGIAPWHGVMRPPGHSLLLPRPDDDAA